MMKRLVTFVFVVIIMISISVPCFAENTQHDVYAKYVESALLCGRSAVKGGSATVMLSDGTVITVSGIPSDDYVLYVKEIAEDPAMQWFSQCLSGQAKVLYPFDICLLEGEKRIVLSNDIDLQISFSKKMCDKLYFLDTNGKITVPSYSMKAGVFSFKSKLDAYCVIASYARQPISPQTGDNSHPYLWGTIAFLGLLSTVFLLSKHKRRT